MRRIGKHIGITVVLLFLQANASLRAEEEHPFKQAFEMNCMACHKLDSFSVGPSLVEISKTYPESERAAFVAWALDPGKKNPKAIQMPAMSHLGKEPLEGIHEYILSVSVGKKESARRHDFPDFVVPAPTYSHVQRTYMVGASPAAIVVRPSWDLGVVWDAATCRLRYVFPGTGDFYQSNRKEAELVDQMLFQETAKDFWLLECSESVEFKGYKIVDGYPEFRYTVGKLDIRETVRAGDMPRSIVRRFAVEGADEGLELNLSHGGSYTVRSDKGTVAANVLRLSPDDVQHFELLLSPKS